MRGVCLAMVLAMVAPACFCARQAPASDPHNLKDDKSIQDATPSLSDADKSLGCPVSAPLGALPEGVYRVGGEIQPPKVLKQPSASYTKEARKMMKKAHVKSFDVESDLLVVVGTDGNPRDICVTKPAGYGLDGEAFKATQKYRFAPARKSDGTSVAVIIPVVVRFRTL